jgi:hypothetical protein
MTSRRFLFVAFAVLLSWASVVDAGRKEREGRDRPKMSVRPCHFCNGIWLV